MSPNGIRFAAKSIRKVKLGSIWCNPNCRTNQKYFDKNHEHKDFRTQNQLHKYNDNSVNIIVYINFEDIFDHDKFER